jgi:hypothetical protein
MKSKKQFLAALAKLDADCGTKKYRKQLESYIVDRHNYQTPPFTCVALTLEIGGRKFYADGYARQNPVDEWKPIEGLGRAYDRALCELCRQVEETMMVHWWELS